MFDAIITGAVIDDGSGEPCRVGDLGIRDGRIVAIGTADWRVSVVIDGGGLVACAASVVPA